MARARSKKAPEDTRAKIHAAALASFRKKGFDATTMREIASAAGVALGAAYYYFPSKDAIALRYYEDTQAQAEARADEVFARSSDLRERLAACFHPRLDVLARDRKLLSSLFRSIADPSAPLSIFAAETRGIRARSIAVFDRALEGAGASTLEGDARRVLVLALWSLHMGVILYFIHDTSPRQEKTRALVDRSLDLVVGLLPLAPQLAPVFGDAIGAILADAGLLGAGEDKG
jgi:AcrR family transcriptional regulator